MSTETLNNEIRFECAASNITASNMRKLVEFDSCTSNINNFTEWSEYLLRYLEINQLYKKPLYDKNTINEIMKFLLKSYQKSKDPRFLNTVLKYTEYKKKHKLSTFVMNQVDNILEDYTSYDFRSGM